MFKSLLNTASYYGINIEEWDLTPSVYAVYCCSEEISPVIGLNLSFFRKKDDLFVWSVIAKNIGYFIATKGKPFFYIQKHSSFCKNNIIHYCAARWAVKYLISKRKLKTGINNETDNTIILDKYFTELSSVKIIIDEAQQKKINMR